MIVLQFCGMSGSGKSTLANGAKAALNSKGISVEIIDGDVYRREICTDLGFSKTDRMENIRRLAFIANRFSKHGIVAIIAAINPYESVRKEVETKYNNVKTIFISSDIETLLKRDTKGLYKRALLPTIDPNYIANFTGVNDPFEVPENPHLLIETNKESQDDSINKLCDFIVDCLKDMTDQAIQC